MKIHFVCSGNIFRSRLAEAYLKSKKISSLEISSSGTRANHNLPGEVCFYTVEVAKKYQITAYLSSNWTLTTKELLTGQDLIIFMKDNHRQFCEKDLSFKAKNYQVWGIEDIPDEMLLSGNRDEIIDLAEQKFLQIT